MGSVTIKLETGFKSTTQCLHVDLRGDGCWCELLGQHTTCEGSAGICQCIMVDDVWQFQENLGHRIAAE